MSRSPLEVLPFSADRNFLIAMTASSFQGFSYDSDKTFQREFKGGLIGLGNTMTTLPSHNRKSVIVKEPSQLVAPYLTEVEIARHVFSAQAAYEID